MTPEYAHSPVAAERRPSGAADLALRIAGGAVAVLAALVTGVLELLLAYLRVGGVLIGLAVPVTVVANILLARFAVAAVGRRWALALPALAWFLLMVVAASPTEEGDLLLTGSWVGLLMLVGGSITFAVVAFRMIMQGPRVPRS